jgi:hypothetical protein
MNAKGKKKRKGGEYCDGPAGSGAASVERRPSD